MQKRWIILLFSIAIFLSIVINVNAIESNQTNQTTTTTVLSNIQCNEKQSDGICPSNCLAGSDYDCCSNIGWCPGNFTEYWPDTINGGILTDVIYSCYPCTQTINSCLNNASDGVCPDNCRMYSDYDCCTKQGYCHDPSITNPFQSSCVPCGELTTTSTTTTIPVNQTTTTTLKIFNATNSTNASTTTTTIPGTPSLCSTIPDTLCPSSCSAGSDVDCCAQAGQCWYNGLCDVCQSTKPTTILAPNSPSLQAESNSAGGILLTWTRSSLEEKELTGEMVVNQISQSLTINQVTGGVSFIDSIVNFFKSVLGIESTTPEITGLSYNIYRNNQRIASGSDELCSDSCQYIDEAQRTGLFTYYIEACYESQCTPSNTVSIEVIVQNSLPEEPPQESSTSTTIPNQENDQEQPELSTSTTLPSNQTSGLSNGTTTTPTTLPIISSSLCSTIPDTLCPSVCAAGSDYDCCKSSGKCWFYSGVDRAGCYECNIVTGFCSTISDGVCPSGCSAGSDSDCCQSSGKCWFASYGCYECNQKPGSCTSIKDEICPSSCTAGSDADCCEAKGMCWIQGKGCAFAFCGFTTSTTLPYSPPSSGGSSGSSGGSSGSSDSTTNQTTTTTTLSSGTNTTTTTTTLSSGTTSSTTTTTTTTTTLAFSCETSGDNICPPWCAAG
ncbi:MAG TPA: hypothetical protein VJJ21_02335, partial [Candidatus Nanoarchaeia archaeon]|nr:hypothetical protein [Candidatus Nanoarchaeia archaeon]